MSAALQLTGLRRTFYENGQPREVLRGVDLSVAPGEFVALVGPSGCGKTTLLSIAGALDAGYEGQAEVLGQDLGKLSDDARAALRAERIGFVFQAFHLLEHLTAVENVELARWLLDDGDADEGRAKAEAALQRVGLGDRLQANVPAMSGGERQRVAVARALITQPSLLLADEPTGNLDEKTGAEILDLFEQLRQEDCAVLVATHNPALAARADRIVRIEQGALVDA